MLNLILLQACKACESVQSNLAEINSATSEWDYKIAVVICFAVIVCLLIIVLGKRGHSKENKYTHEDSCNTSNNESNVQQSREIEKQKHEDAIAEMVKKAELERKAAEEDFMRLEAILENTQRLKTSGLEVKINLSRGPYKIEISSSKESVQTGSKTIECKCETGATYI